VADGTAVAAGQVLAELQSPDLSYQQRAAQARAAGLRWQLAAAGVDVKLRDRSGVTEAQAAKVAAELNGIARQQARHALRAPSAGHLVYEQPDLAEGAWVRKDEALARVVDLAHWHVDVYLPEAELARVQVGDTARFLAESGAGAPLPLTVTAIDSDASRTLPEPLLASVRGGAVLVREQHRQLVPETALYRVRLAVAEDARPAGTQVLRGSVVIQGRPKAWLDDAARSAAALWLREAGF
jgi:putative peptide zinc metalloprotease protein